MIDAIEKFPNQNLVERGVKNLIKVKKKLGLGAKPKNGKSRRSDESWAQSLADELHKPIRRNFIRHRVMVNRGDEIWSADLVDMQAFSKWNKGVRYLLNVIDLFSKYAWCIPVTSKTGKSITNAFQLIIDSSKRKPKMLWVDQGSELYNRIFDKWLRENKIERYSTHNEGKTVIIERFNRSLKGRM